MNLVALALVIFLVMFLWRKLTILEGNFYILEKRINLMKKESKENNIAKNIERSNAVMNEIFNDSIPASKSKTVGTCSFPLKQVEEITIITTEIPNKPIKSDDKIKELNDDVKISFNTDDLDKKITESIDAIDIINAVAEEKKDVDDTVSTTSDFVFNASDDKQFDQKKLSKLSIDKLKELCSQHHLSTEGTKAQLVSRILESHK
jgi:hypothetical protein